MQPVVNGRILRKEMANFTFLSNTIQYQLFAPAAIEAEKVFATSPAICAIGTRKALELAVKWVFAADPCVQMPYRDNLQSLVHEESFRFLMDNALWRDLQVIIRLGNLAVHTERAVSASDAVYSLHILFDFIQWIDYCYGDDYVERVFDEQAIPIDRTELDYNTIREQESIIRQKAEEIEQLRRQVEEFQYRYSAEKEMHMSSRAIPVTDRNEDDTRKLYIDTDLKELGWKFDGIDADVQEEYEVHDLRGIIGQTGYADYVLFGKDGLPLAVIEAKRTSKDANAGKNQAVEYADCLERKFSRRPMIFTTNGFDTYFWDDTSGIPRRVSGMFSKDDLQKLMNRRAEKLDLYSIAIDEKITDRYYQKEAIRAVCDHLNAGFRRNLLVMATGTGKTRTASSLADVLSRGKHVTNILFLADRTALVKQAKDDFKNYLPDMSLCNLCDNKEDRNARIVFSTYPTMLNAIDSAKSADGLRVYTPAHFDLIIIDESHRSIFRKYKAIFEYFDAILVGLTATPKKDVDRNTYDFFELEQDVPTYAYDYETAVYTDHVLVPYYNYEVKTKFIDEGITYDQLSKEDQERYEDDFAEDGYMPEFIPSEDLNKFVFNEKTVDLVLQDLMERGIKIEGGDKLGKTIIFAQNKKHAAFIVDRFNKLYPEYNGKFIERVLCDDSTPQSVIDNFKKPEGNPQITVSVDMLDTGIDVPSCVNLVFFKKVRSKTKFWQMIGRGTRLCPDLGCIDQIDGEYEGKKRFLIFDYCSNFEFFREKPNGFESKEVKTLSESIFCKRVRLAVHLQEPEFNGDDYRKWRTELVTGLHRQVCALSTELVSVRLKLRYVEKYRDLSVYDNISDEEKGELMKEIAPLIVSDDTDEAAKRFDNFMYGLMLSGIEKTKMFSYAKRVLCNTAAALERKNSIDAVKAKMPLIKSVNTEDFWNSNNILLLEEVRRELRDLIKFLIDGTGHRDPVVTNLSDPIIDQDEGKILPAAYDFENYRLKVNRYINEHGDSLAIYKLKHNIPLESADYSELERVLTSELGSADDYHKEFGDTPFGLMVRKIAKLDHDAAMKAFSVFIDDQSLNQRQIAFVHKVINYIELNGYMESVADLAKPPFDKPVSFMKLFDPGRKKKLIEAIEAVKKNAVDISA